METSENASDLKPQLWFLIGPLSLLLTGLLQLMKPAANHLYLPYFAIFGLFFCWQWKLKGLTLVLATLSLLIIYQFNHIPETERLWELGMAVATALGLFITALSCEEAYEPFHAIFQQSNDLQQENENLQNKIQTLEIESNHSMALLRSNLAGMEEQSQQSKKEFQHKIIFLEHDAEKLKNENRSLKSSLTELDLSYRNLCLTDAAKEEEIETLKKQLSDTQKLWEESQKVVKEKENTCDSNEIKRYKGLYLQLKEQFEEKSAQLDKIRYELFHAHEELEHQRRSKEEQDAYNRSSFEKELEDYIAMVEKQYQNQTLLYQQEIQQQEDLITLLLTNEKPQT